MEAVLGKNFYTTSGMDSTYELLKNGVLLCEFFYLKINFLD